MDGCWQHGDPDCELCPPDPTYAGSPLRLTDAMARTLRDHGERVRKVMRVFAPRDSDGEAEVLYLDGEGRACTAYVRDGRDAPAPIICAGW